MVKKDGMILETPSLRVKKDGLVFETLFSKESQRISKTTFFSL